MKFIWAAGLNSLAMHFGGFGRRSDGFAFVLVFLAFACVLIWAVSRSGGSESQKS